MIPAELEAAIVLAKKKVMFFSGVIFDVSKQKEYRTF